MAKHGVLIDIDTAELLDCSLALLDCHDGGLVDFAARGTTRARLNQPRAMAPWVAGHWVAVSSNALRPWFERSSPCTKIECVRCSGSAGCDFQADLDWRGMRGDRPVMGMRRPKSIITIREFIVMDSGKSFPIADLSLPP